MNVSVDAIDRLGDGPWYDRYGRIVAQNKTDLTKARPVGAHLTIANDFPNEYGVPNHRPDPSKPAMGTPHVLTGSNEDGRLYSATSTCDSWTSREPSAGRPRVGFSWTANARINWISGFLEGGCGAGATLQDGPPDPSNSIVASGGGYGAIYCFAMTP